MLELKNTEHEYYCSDENFLKGDTLQTFCSWVDFEETMFFQDEDLNLLFRYDISDFKHEGFSNIKTLNLYFVLQRKAYFVPVRVYIKQEDMGEVNKFLKLRWQHMNKLWEEVSKQEIWR